MKNGKVSPAAMARLRQTRRTVEKMITAPFVGSERSKARGEVRAYYNDFIAQSRIEIERGFSGVTDEDRALIDHLEGLVP